MDKNLILEFFNLKDKKIVFEDGFNKILEIEKKGDEKIKIIKGILSYVPKKCFKCGSSNLVKNGFDIVDIQISNMLDVKTKLRLKKQKVKCKNCNCGFTVSCKDCKKHSRKSTSLLTNIDYELSTTTNSLKNIAEKNNVSTSTVKRKIEELSSEIKVNKVRLPRVLCIDELHGVETFDGKYNCVIVNGENHTLKDILVTRRQDFLEKYFKSYTKKSRDNVEFFVTDMYDTYIRLAKKEFRNAEIIVDKFHIINNVIRAIDNIRIETMNKFKRDCAEYRLLKKFHKKLKKRFSKISTKTKKYKFHNDLKSEFDLLKRLLGINKDLEITYHILQDLYLSFENKSVEKFREILENDGLYLVKNKKWKACVKSLFKYQKYIENAIKYEYTNGITESINRKIKDIKRNAYGYTNFRNFRTRVMLYFNFVQLRMIVNKKNKSKKIQKNNLHFERLQLRKII